MLFHMALPIKFFCQQIDKDTLWQNELLTVFFKGAAIKMAVLVGSRTTLVSLC